MLSRAFSLLLLIKKAYQFYGKQWMMTAVEL